MSCDGHTDENTQGQRARDNQITIVASPQVHNIKRGRRVVCASSVCVHCVMCIYYRRGPYSSNSSGSGSNTPSGRNEHNDLFEIRPIRLIIIIISIIRVQRFEDGPRMINRSIARLRYNNISMTIIIRFRRRIELQLFYNTQ